MRAENAALTFSQLNFFQRFPHAPAFFHCENQSHAAVARENALFDQRLNDLQASIPTTV